MVDEGLAALLIELFRAIHSISGYPMPAILPEVHAVPLQQLQARVCSWACPVKAFYLKGEGIFIEQSLDFRRDPRARAILLHELVHHLQNLSARFDSLPSCEAWYAREHEAYVIQNEYLRVEGEAVRQYMAGFARRCTDGHALFLDQPTCCARNCKLAVRASSALARSYEPR